MDAVVLAAGKGSRLEGYVPAYAKPLIPINGVPLVQRIVRDALAVVDGMIFVIVAPENREAIEDLTKDDRVRIIVQHTPLGPGDALLRGLRIATSGCVLVLCSDNLMSRESIRDVADYNTDYTMAFRTMRTDEALRFTRITQDLHVIEGEPGGRWEDYTYRCWVGPLEIPRVALLEVLERVPRDQGEVKLGKHLGDLAWPNWTPVLIDAHVMDIGTPESYTNQLAHEAADTFLRWPLNALAHSMIELGMISSFECQMPKCLYDFREFSKSERKHEATFDHIVRRAFGGDDRTENLRIVHRGCNSSYGDRSEAQHKPGGHCPPESVPRGDDHWSRRVPITRTCPECDYIGNPGNVAQHTQRVHRGVTLSDETRNKLSEAAKSQWEKMTPEERSLQALTAWETRRES